jgi:LysM repeat protein
MSSPVRPTPALLAALGATAVGAPGLGLALAPPAAAAPEEVHVVTAGETLSHIAVRTGSSVEALAEANGLPDPRVLQVGQRLAVPAAQAAPAPTATAAATVTVKAGDTLSHIAARTSTTVEALAGANGLVAPYRLTVGQRVALPAQGLPAPAPAPAPAAPAAPVLPGPTVTVAAGDTLSAIADRAGIALADLLTSSGLRAGDVIRPGQQVTLPAPPAPAPPVASTFAGRTYPPEVTARATANRDILASRPAPTREEVRELVTATAREMGVDPALALAVAHQESGFNARAVSPANALGAMQVIPSSGRWASGLVGRELDLLDPHDNAVAGVAILRSLLTSTGGDEATALAGYYQGLASVQSRGLYDDTRRYVANVQTLAARYR